MATTTYTSSNSFDVGNFRAFSSNGGIRYYSGLTGWLDAGEQALVMAASARLKQPRTLDIGVGTGRTVPLMRGLAGTYVAIDMGRRMIEAAQRCYPGVDARIMDARALDFADAAFDLVTFSFNGLDGMPLSDRDRALAEIARVTRPGGLFAFSSMNRTGPGFAEKFSLTARRSGRPRATEGVRVAVKGVIGYRNYWRNRRFGVTNPEVAISTSSAHNFAVVLVFASVAAQVAALARHGFVIEQAFSDRTGATVPLDRDDTESVWLHYLARRQVS